MKSKSLTILYVVVLVSTGCHKQVLADAVESVVHESSCARPMQQLESSRHTDIDDLGISANVKNWIEIGVGADVDIQREFETVLLGQEAIERQWQFYQMCVAHEGEQVSDPLWEKFINVYYGLEDSD